MKVDNFVEVKAELTSEDFMRAVLLKIAAEENAPADVFTAASFSKPRLTTEEIIVTQAKVNLDYTCEIGYDKTEQYFDNYSKTTKTRNVIDWKPFSGRTSGNETLIVRNGETDPFKVRE
ncbi:MAG: hypothetical protein K2K39_00150 [Clostridia bacterium]|nr:hypothetical protein [Clostridia bacterium]